jgi:predicted Zn-dependent protease
MAPPKLTRDVRDALALYGYVLLSARHTEKAHAVFQGMHALFPDDTHVTKCLAVTSLATGNAEAAAALVDGIRGAVSADDRQTLDFVRGKAMFALGRAGEARTSLTRALTQRSASPATGAGSRPQ